MKQSYAQILVTFIVALIGVGIFRALSLPLPWLLGPMIGCLVAALAGVRLRNVKIVSNVTRTVLGVAIGASITPAAIARLGDMALSIALIPPFIVLIGLIGYPYFRRLWGFDPATSYYSAMPGGLIDMMLFGEEAGGDPRVLGLVHATRILLIVTLLPLIMAYGFGYQLDLPPGAPLADVPATELLLMAIIAIAGWQAAKNFGMIGAAILGPMILAMLASLTGMIHQRPPAEAILAAQFFIGSSIGVKYVGVTATELRRVITAAAGYSCILALLSLAFSALVIRLGLAPPLEAILAFSPGGQGEMAVLAIVTGADIAFVVTHHIIRIVTVIIGAPLINRLMK